MSIAIWSVNIQLRYNFQLNYDNNSINIFVIKNKQTDYIYITLWRQTIIDFLVELLYINIVVYAAYKVFE